MRFFVKTRFLFLYFVLCLSSCAKKDEFVISKESVAPASKIDWLGTDTALLGEGKIGINKPLPEARLVNSSMKEDAIKADGKVKLVSILPSLDTEVCDRQTHILSETKMLNAKIERITVSRDLPYAQSRFAQESKLKNIRYLSDYRYTELGKAFGLEIERNHLLARAILVVDGVGKIRYLQIVPKIYALPDMDAAIQKANEIQNTGG